MSRNQYLIIFTGSWDEEPVENVFFDQLLSLQSSFGFESVQKYKSDLIDLSFNYFVHNHEITNLLDGRISWAVIKLTLNHDDLIVDKKLDRLFRDCVGEFDEPMYSSLHYFIERNGKVGFHRISRLIENGETDDENHLDMEGLLTCNPSLYYNHFNNIPYTDEQSVEIAKRLLVVGGVS